MVGYQCCVLCFYLVCFKVLENEVHIKQLNMGITEYSTTGYEENAVSMLIFYISLSLERIDL